jgi:hypothetical protein
LPCNGWGICWAKPAISVAAERTLQLFWPHMSRSPGGFGSLLRALEEALAPPEIIILKGPADEMVNWCRASAPIRGGWCWPCPTELPVCRQRWPSRKAIMSTPGSAKALLAPHRRKNLTT